jgi:hypothetical protein
MQLKRYTIASFIFIFLVGMATYSISANPFSFDLLGIHFPNLPIAFWVIVPMALMYLVSVLHMAFHALLGDLKLRKLDRDNEKMIDAITDGLLGATERTYVFKSDAYKLMGKVLTNVVLLPNEALKEVGQEKLDEAFRLVRDVKEKKKVDLKKFHLTNSSALGIQNNLNRLERGELGVEEILSRLDTYGTVVASKAYESYVKTASVGSVLKYKQLFTITSLKTFLERINSDVNGISMGNDELLELFKLLNLSEEDYLELAMGLSKNMLPEQRIRLFETASERNDDAMKGYLYTLYDLQMIDTANEILNNTAKEDYLVFKAYRDLKAANKHYDIALFLKK